MDKQPSAQSNLKIVSVGDNPELLWLREAVLRSAGFEVFTTNDEQHALMRIRKGDCGVLLLCHSLEEPRRQLLSDEYRKACPTGRVVVITNTKLSSPPPEADTFVYGV